MITNYDKFVESQLNEGILSSLKGFFTSMFKNVSDQIKKPLDDMTKKLETTKDPTVIKKMVSDYMTNNSKELHTMVTNCKTPQEIVKAVKDNVMAIYFAIDAVNKSYGDSQFKFEDIFADSTDNIKKLFTKDEKNFNKNVLGFSKALVVNFAKSSGYDKTVMDELNKINENFLFEADQPSTDPNQQANTTVNDANTVMGEEAKPVENQTDPKLEKLKKSITTWFDNTLFKGIKTEISKLNTDAKPDENTSIDKAIENVKATNNKDSVKKILQSITQIQDKETLIALRDFLNSKGIDLTKENAPL